jgi:hypothetical protein
MLPHFMAFSYGSGNGEVFPLASTKPRFATIVLSSLLISAAPAFAHHSFNAEFDGAKCADFTGTLTGYDWENPHAYFNLDIKDDGGAVSSWTFEAVSVAWMKRSGTQRRDFIDNIGKVVKVRACLAKNGTKRAAAETIKTPDGRTLRVGTDYEHGESPN